MDIAWRRSRGLPAPHAERQLLAAARSLLDCEGHPTGEMGVVGGSVPGEGGEGTSILGVVPGSSDGAWVGCPGCEG